MLFCVMKTWMFLIGFSSGPRFEIRDNSLLYKSKQKSKVEKMQWYAQLLKLHKTWQALLSWMPSGWLHFIFCISSFLSEGTRRPMSPLLFVIKEMIAESDRIPFLCIPCSPTVHFVWFSYRSMQTSHRVGVGSPYSEAEEQLQPLLKKKTFFFQVTCI